MSSSRSPVKVGENDCWGRKRGEDGQTEACRLCVNLCPEVFEKPDEDRPAKVRFVVQLGMNLNEDVKMKLRKAVWQCPSNAIRWVSFDVKGPPN